MEGKDQVRDLLKKDITVKILSVLIAVIFWLFVYNTSNPFTDRTYSVPVRIVNQDYPNQNGYIIKNINTNNIDVTVRGRKEVLDEVRASDFNVSLDLSQIKSVNDKKLELNPPELDKRDVKIISYTPATVDIILVRNKSGTFPVELKPNITMKPGYVLLKTTVTPDTLPIYNMEESVIDSIDKIVASLDVKNLDRDTIKEVKCAVYSKDGKEIRDLSDGFKVNVKLEVAKEVPVYLVTRGKLADDYIETLRVIDPVKVLLTGPADILGNIEEIKTEQVDIDKITSNFTASVQLIVPEGAELYNKPKNITVNINVEKLVTKDIELSKDDISVLNANNDGSLTYGIKTEKLTVQIKGRQSDVNAVKKESMKPAVDVSGLKEGIHKLPLSIILPSQVKLMQQHEVEVAITKNMETVTTQEP